MLPLIQGWEWLTGERQKRIVDAVPRTLLSTSYRSAQGANWHAIADADGPPLLCQHCHGASGMVTTFADTPIVCDELDA